MSEQEIQELLQYKNMWQSIAGKANLKKLVADVEKLQRENQILREALTHLAYRGEWIEAGGWNQNQEAGYALTAKEYDERVTGSYAEQALKAADVVRDGE